MKSVKAHINTISAWVTTQLAPSKQDDEGYYACAKIWYHERYELLEVSRNRYKLLSIALGCLLGLSLLSYSVMLPLKQYIYRLVEVNKQTGEVTALKESEGEKYSSNWIVTRYFIHHFVINRHIYHHEDIKRTLNLALAMSAKTIADSLTDAIIDTNPQSPLNVLNTTYYRDVEILGISQLNDNTALIRLKTITKNKNIKSDTKEENLQAVIKWEYRDTASTLKDRDRNPLGFFVTYYQESPAYADYH